MCTHTPISGLVGGIMNQPSGQCVCVIFVFGVIFDCWMAPRGRWCCRTMVGPSDIARVMQLLEDDERLRLVARRLDVSLMVVIRLWRSYQETGEYTRNRVKAVPGLQPQNQTVFLYCCLSSIE